MGLGAVVRVCGCVSWLWMRGEGRPRFERPQELSNVCGWREGGA